MKALGVPIFPIIAVVDDGSGRWEEGLSYGVFHPSALGHHFVFRGLLESLAAVLVPERCALIMGRASTKSRAGCE